MEKEISVMCKVRREERVEIATQKTFTRNEYTGGKRARYFFRGKIDGKKKGGVYLEKKFCVLPGCAAWLYACSEQAFFFAHIFFY